MSSNIRLISTDVDGTLVGDPEEQQQFKGLWWQMPPDERPFLCYNTGRLLEDAQQHIAQERLPMPDYIIGGVGTSIYDVHQQTVLKEFSEILEEGWDVEKVEQTVYALNEELNENIHKQPPHHQNAYKSSWYWYEAAGTDIDLLRQRLEEAALEATIVYSSSLHLDILPKWANKGNALRWLLRHLNISGEEVLVIGDSGNDSAMFTIEGVRGIVVGNAQPELYEATKHLPIYHAPQQESGPAAVINGMRHYGLFQDAEAGLVPETEENVLYESLRASGEEALLGLTPEQLALIRTGYEHALEGLRKNISSLGFTACSLEDNDTIGTDENYFSVWARDGSITLIGTLPLTHRDPEVRECQRQTLVTLLDNASPVGQIPANVRLADKAPDYSGVGGIASIDSGLWVIIALYAYVQRTQDIDLLRGYRETLQAIMNWLSAQDSNNDALLEIPEAGDWTDLFGRSYNVLYDEVLWYRCNICFARMLQMLGEEERAGDYLRWARVIKREILANFWPTTQQRIYQTVSFAEQQFSLGDARYLIAQVTPFDFSWRCDTYGNILAFLYDVTDAKRAAQTFRFMWGVGVNEPHPVRNLYPVVTVGDKDWRPYYAVNLLNLPNHYHNGGVWPLVGGDWVRFLEKLGLQDLALKELYRLAELNKLGVLHEWEFNEWAHGQTGRPMGKAYQAWSISSYIYACHKLRVIP